MSRVLVVDDVAKIRDPIVTYLRQAGYETTVAPDGKSALAAVRSSKPDLMVLDIALAGMDGLTVLRMLRADKPTSDLPVMLLTATADRKTVISAAELGVKDYL